MRFHNRSEERRADNIPGHAHLLPIDPIPSEWLDVELD
jgi:hypothetical protein